VAVTRFVTPYVPVVVPSCVAVARPASNEDTAETMKVTEGKGR
jgi:hypothetical protein